MISSGHARFVNEIHRHNSDIVNYSSSLRANEDNLNDVCLKTSKPAVVNHGQGSQDSNNVKTKVEPSSMHRETIASSIRVAPASSKSSSGGSGGSSNPTSMHLKAKSIYVKKEPFWLKTTLLPRVRLFVLVWFFASLSVGVKCPARDGAQCKFQMGGCRSSAGHDHQRRSGRRHDNRALQPEEGALFPRPQGPDRNNVNENQSTRTLRWPTHVPM